MSQLSLLLTYARCQRSTADMLAKGARNIRRGVYKAREKHDQNRWIKYQKADLNQQAAYMKDVVKSRIADIEETSNELLIAAIERLSTSRLNRIEYAGRVLP